MRYPLDEVVQNNQSIVCVFSVTTAWPIIYYVVIRINIVINNYLKQYINYFHRQHHTTLNLRVSSNEDLSQHEKKGDLQ